MTFRRSRASRCLANPGVGKSWSLAADVDAYLQQSSGMPTVRLDLRSFSSESQLPLALRRQLNSATDSRSGLEPKLKAFLKRMPHSLEAGKAIAPRTPEVPSSLNPLRAQSPGKAIRACKWMLREANVGNQAAVSNAMSARYLTESEVSERTHIRLATLRRWRLGNRGPKYYKFGSLVRYGEEELTCWEQAQPSDGEDATEPIKPKPVRAICSFESRGERTSALRKTSSSAIHP
jgi:hypothetical protein